MQSILYILLSSVRLILYAWSFLFFISAILSWLPEVDNAFTDFVFSVTEPVLERLGISSALPIDLAYLAVMILLSIVLTFL